MPNVRIPLGPAYPDAVGAGRFVEKPGCPPEPSGFITEVPLRPTRSIRDGQADCVLLARELLRDPYFCAACRARAWPHQVPWPAQYPPVGTRQGYGQKIVAGG